MAVSMALAMLIKSVWLMLPLLFFAIWALNRTRNGFAMRNAPDSAAQDTACGNAASGNAASGFRRPLLGECCQLIAATAVALTLVNTFYGFRGSGQSLSCYDLVSETLRDNGSLLASCPIPLPANYVQGIDVQCRDFDRGRFDPSWQSYLMGSWQQGGWWYYYIVGLFVKVPLVTWLLVGIATCYACLLYTSPSPRDKRQSRMPSSA